MKKIITLSLIALTALTANAQMSVQDSIKAEKAAKAAQLKAEKAAKARELKAFKARQADALKAFINAQKNGTSTTVKPSSEVETAAYYLGIKQSNGFKKYLTGQLNVDTTYMEDFVAGLNEAACADLSDKKVHAYQAGISIGGQLKQMNNSFEREYYAADEDSVIAPRFLTAGFIGAITNTAKLTVAEANDRLQPIMAERKKYNDEKMFGATRAEGEKFLAENKTKPGVVALPSGLQYKIITAGDENAPKATNKDKVKVHYEGRLLDGTVFDSSYKRGEPTSFGVTQVIKGWTEALKLMPVGSKWEIYIPYNLGYGERGAGDNIKPYATLIFTVELLEVIAR